MSKANPRFRRNNPSLPVVLNNVWRVRMIGTVEGQLTINTFFYLDTNGPNTGTVTIANSLVTAFMGAGGVEPLYIACMSADWSLQGYTVDSPNNPFLSTVQGTFGAVGGGPNGHEPTTVGVVISRFSAIKGQCGRGHITLPAVPTAWVTASTLTNTTAHTALANKLSADLVQGGNTFTPCIYSRAGSHYQPQKGAAAVEAALVRTTLGTVRRRKLGRGK